jgi:hypothetical protein
VTPDAGYKLDKLTATNTSTKKEITLKESGKNDGKYTFTAPSNNVKVEATFVKIGEVTVTAEPATNGTVKVNADKVATGSTIVVTATPDKGYLVDTVTAVDSAGKALKVDFKDGQYLITAPDKADTVKVTATFKADPNAKPAQPTQPASPFTDVPADAYFADAVDWAVNKGITNGMTATTFGPNEVCTRAQAMTFMWRFLGQPAHTSTNNPFTDVSADAYYYDAVLWAVENGVTKGTSATTFSPNDMVTRAQLVTFVYRYLGEPEVSQNNPFTDVSSDAYYYDAVMWANSLGVVQGVTGTTFVPNGECQRAHIVTILYRASAVIA